MTCQQTRRCTGTGPLAARRRRWHPHRAQSLSCQLFTFDWWSTAQTLCVVIRALDWARFPTSAFAKLLILLRHSKPSNSSLSDKNKLQTWIHKQHSSVFAFGFALRNLFDHRNCFIYHRSEMRIQRLPYRERYGVVNFPQNGRSCLKQRNFHNIPYAAGFLASSTLFSIFGNFERFR